MCYSTTKRTATCTIHTYSSRLLTAQYIPTVALFAVTDHNLGSTNSGLSVNYIHVTHFIAQMFHHIKDLV